MYDGEYKPMVAARIVATAHRFNELMQPDLASNQSPSVDDAIATLRGEARDTVDQAMLVLLVGALGVFGCGARHAFRAAGHLAGFGSGRLCARLSLLGQLDSPPLAA